MKSLPLTLCAFAALSFLSAFAAPVGEMLTDAQRDYMRGDLDLAKAKFEQALVADPRNPTAIGHLKMIKAKQAQADPSNLRQKQLAKVIMPRVEFKEASLGSVLQFLKQNVAKITEDQQSVNFVLKLSEEEAAKPVSLSLTNVPFPEVLNYLGTLANVSFTYEKYAILVQPSAK